MKKTSVDSRTKVFDTIPKNKNNKEISLNIKKMDYIAYFYDEFWWVGIAEDVSELDTKEKFIHPHRPVKISFNQSEMMSAGCSIPKLYA